MFLGAIESTFSWLCSSLPQILPLLYYMYLSYDTYRKILLMYVNIVIKLVISITKSINYKV